MLVAALLVGCVPGTLEQPPEPLTVNHVVLTPTTTPDTSQSFSWVVADDTAATLARIAVQPIGGGDAISVSARRVGTDADGASYYSATVSGLQPATAYRYRVGSAERWTDWWHFETAAADLSSFQFVYYGDAQLGLDTTWPAVVEQADAVAPDAIGSVHAGDLVEASEASQWTSWFDGLGEDAATSNVIAAPGNHEYIDDSDLRRWQALFEYPRNGPTASSSPRLSELATGTSQVARQYRVILDQFQTVAADTTYFVDYGSVRFVVLNASQSTEALTPPTLPPCDEAACLIDEVGELWVEWQAAWLDQVLESSEARWNIVTFHQPVLSASVGRDEPELRVMWLPVFERRDVDLVLMGHDHVYARGYLNDDLTAQQGVTDGPVYIVSNAGAKHYELSPETDNVWTQNGATQVRRGQGVTTVQVIDVSPERLHYHSWLVEKGPAADTDVALGSVWDEFVIRKDAAGTKRVDELFVVDRDGGNAG